MGISEKLSILMKNKGISRYKLAKECGVPYTTLIKILDGTTKNPQIESLSLIADYLGVSLDYIRGQSLGALLEERLLELKMTLEDLSKATGIQLEYLQNIDSTTPSPWDYEPGKLIDRLAQALQIGRRELESAYFRLEPPVYDGPVDKRSPGEIFVNEEFENSPDHPKWATNKDIRDFKKMLNEDTPVMFDGVPLDQEDKEKVLKVMEAIFWDAKKKNKRKPIEE